MAASYTERAIVVTRDAVAYGSGWQGGPPIYNLLNEPARLLDGASLRFPGEGVLMLGGVTVQQWAAYTATLPDRWLPGAPGAWITYRPAGETGAIVHVGLLDEIDPARCPLFHPREDDPTRVAELLAAYHVATGAPWHGTGGVAGHGGIRARYAEHARGQLGGTPLWFHRGPTAEQILASGPLIWHRDLGDDEAWYGFVITFDINAQYLSAARNALLAWDVLEEGRTQWTGRPEVDDDGRPVGQGRAGYWNIDVSGCRQDGPWVVNPRRILGNTAWVTAPVLAYLRDRGIKTHVHQSLTCARGEYLLRGWAERLRDARQINTAIVRSGAGPGSTAAGVLRAVKRTYTESVGLLGHEGGRIYRPDWQQTIIDQARMSLLRRIDKVRDRLGVDPIRVNVDAVSYLWPTMDDRDLARWLGVADGIGTFKHVSTITVDEYRAKYAKRDRKRAGQRP